MRVQAELAERLAAILPQLSEQVGEYTHAESDAIPLLLFVPRNMLNMQSAGPARPWLECISACPHRDSAAQGALQYFKIFARTMQREWFGIDKLRLDKFMMLARQVLRQVYMHLQKMGWCVSDPG